METSPSTSEKFRLDLIIKVKGQPQNIAEIEDAVAAARNHIVQAIFNGIDDAIKLQLAVYGELKQCSAPQELLDAARNTDFIY